MARLRTETAPEITVNDESVVFKAASGATAPLVEFKNSAGTVVGNIAANGVMNVTSVFASNAGSGSTALATRGYVDDLFAGVSWQNPVALATTAALPSCTYNNGTAGVGATLTATANGVLTIDLGTTEAGYSILVKNQATATQNGIYTVTTAGAAGTPFVLTRRTDSDNNPAGEVTKGDAVFVVAGSANINCGFILGGTPSGANNAFVLGTDNLTYAQFTGTGGFTAGDGLVITNNTVNVMSASSSRLVVNADNIDLATVEQTNSSGSNVTSFISGHTVDAYGRVTSTTTSSVSFAGYATLASPSLTGTPLAPTAATNTDNTQIASTEFVINQIENDAVVKTLANAKGDIFTATSDNTPAVLSVGTNGYFLRANSGATNGIDWGVPASAIDDITDVTITSVASGDLLKYNGSAWVNSSTSELIPLNNLSDVTITSASSGQFLKYNGTAWVNDAIDLGTDTTGNYMVNVSSGTGISVSHTQSEGSTATVSLDATIDNLSDVTITSAVSNQVLLYNGSAWVNTSNPTVAGDLTVTGNLTVSGTTTTVNSETLTINDNLIVLNNNEAGTPSENAGVEIERGTSTNVQLRWNETTDCWEFTNDGTNYQRIFTDTVTNAQVASYTLVLADSGKMVEMNNASANTLTIPPNSSVALPVGTTITVLQTGAGQCTLTAGAGVTINYTPGLKLRAQWSSATIIKRATDTWVALGDLAS